MDTYSTYGDDELVQLLITGDEDAFSMIYEKYWRILIGLAFNHTKNRCAAEDIVQEVFLSLWKRKDLVTITSLNAYLATAVKFTIFNHIKLEKRHSEILDSNYAVPGNESLEEKINAKFLQDFVDGIVEQLPEKPRMVYNYSRKQGMTNAEIAEEMQISEKTVEGHLTKALKTVRLNVNDLGFIAFLLFKSRF